MYAIVDIETTGGFASGNSITEIAIVQHDGEKITGQFNTLINPGTTIPYFIQSLTGITNEMVESAPSFPSVAKKIHELLSGRVFIAHNVNFDYSFVRFNLLNCGYDLQVKKLCTVRLARKVLPGYPSYGLGKICRQLNIQIENRHRALGDALATTRLFEIILEKDKDEFISKALKRNSREHILPPNLSKTAIEQVPTLPGVYYFNDKKGKTLYVGKAKNLKKRVLSHFTGNNTGSQRQGFLKYVHSIKYETCGTELMALILEAVEIKRLWPQFNRSMKRFEQQYGLYIYEDQLGQSRFAIDKKRKFSKPLYAFNSLSEGMLLLRKLASDYNLCFKLSGVEKVSGNCSNVNCLVCVSKETVESHNSLLNESLKDYESSLPSFALIDEGRRSDEKSCVLIEKGQLYGMGYMNADMSFSRAEELKSFLKPYPSNDYIRNMVLSYASRFPQKYLSANG